MVHHRAALLQVYDCRPLIIGIGQASKRAYNQRKRLRLSPRRRTYATMANITSEREVTP